MLLLHAQIVELFDTANQLWLMFPKKNFFGVVSKEGCLFLLVYVLYFICGCIKFPIFPCMIFPLDNPYVFKTTVS